MLMIPRPWRFVKGKVQKPPPAHGPGLAFCRNLWYAVCQDAVHIELEKAAGHITPRGGDYMRITFHVGQFTVTIIVKSRNRHSGK